MGLTFVIPTRGRPRELSACVRSIAEQVGKTGTRIVIIYNRGELDTERAVSRARSRWPFIEARAVEGDPDYSDKFRAMMRAAPESDWVWTFGDDDKLQPGALAFMLERLAAASPELSLIHVAERKRAAGTGHTFSGRLADLCCSIGWLEMTGFITGNIVRGAALARAAETPNWDAYAKSAYVHSCALLETLLKDQAQFIDLPLVDSQEEMQTQESVKRWLDEQIPERYFYVADALEIMMEQGFIKKKMPAKFFRYMGYHLWDRHITYFISGRLADGAPWPPKWAVYVKRLAALQNDPYTERSVCADVDRALALSERLEELKAKALAAEGELEAIHKRRNDPVYPYIFTDGSDLKKVAA